MKGKVDNTILWNEAAKAGALFGALSVSCLVLKELAEINRDTFYLHYNTPRALLKEIENEFIEDNLAFFSPYMHEGHEMSHLEELFGCILLMKKVQLDLRDKYQGVRMADCFRMGRRAALLSGLLLASAQALIILYMPQETLDTLVGELSSAMSMSPSQQEQVDGMLDKLPVMTFLFQWLYCYLYGTVLSSIMSRYIFLQKLFGGPFPPSGDEDTPDEQ